MKWLMYSFKVIYIFIFAVSVVENYDINNNIDLFDIPIKSDLQVYLASLRRIIHFFDTHRNDVDINVFFGLFLINVNLKRSLMLPHHLTAPLKLYLSEIIYENDKVLNSFKFRAETDFDPRDQNDKSILSLFSNETLWLRRLPGFTLTPHKEYARRSSEFAANISFRRLAGGLWEKYKRNIYDLEKWVPSPAQSDNCMGSLARSRVDEFDFFPICKIPKNCKKMLINGSDFGYALTHRFLFLLSARYSRDCSVFSPKQDELLRNKFCGSAYTEAEFISFHNYEFLDLMLEQICLCALDGHTEFLRRSWLEDILQFQTEHGCFRDSLNNAVVSEAFQSNTWKLSKVNHQLLGGQCDGHLTAVAAMTLAVAARFILENYV